MRPTLASVLLALLVAATPAAAQKQKSIYQSKLLWATINVCDTVDHPNTIGIRASIPGSGVRAEEMYMRFQVQYWKASDNSWHNIGPSGDSGFIFVGSGRYRARQAGRNFVLKPPPQGKTHLLRGAVTFEWRRGDKVVRRARKRTRSGHPNTRGADPPRVERR